MHERLLQLRKDLNITQDEFAKTLNISKGHVSTLEKGRRVLTDRIVNDICREFRVNEDWLRSGQGKMYRELNSDNSLAIEIAKLLSSDDAWTKNAVLQFLKLSPEQREVIKKFISEISPQNKNSAGS